jgi:hypothetical protein
MIEKIVLAVVLSLSVYLTLAGRTPNRSATNARIGQAELVAIESDTSR